MPPISPKEISSSDAFPEEVFEAFNTLIKSNHRNGQSVVSQSDVTKLLIKAGFSKEKIYNKKLLDVEMAYREAGWDVTYDKPAPGESFEPYFVFKKKS
jgi:hypothetical protein